MTETTTHLSEWTLEQLAEGGVPGEDLSGATAHVEACGRCAAELDAYRTLFATLGKLPRFAPSSRFSDGVMARVRVAPASAPLWVWLQGWAPRTRRGWALLGTAIAAPAVAFLAAMAWLLSHPLVSPAGLWQWGSVEARGAVEGGVTRAFGWAIDSGMFGAAQTAVDAALALPIGVVAVVVAVLAVAIPLSAWSLIRLIRTPMGNVTYAN